jgi:hypothetical protein
MPCFKKGGGGHTPPLPLLFLSALTRRLPTLLRSHTEWARYTREWLSKLEGKLTGPEPTVSVAPLTWPRARSRGSTLVTGANSGVLLINGAQEKNVIWGIGSAVTVAADSFIEGSILAGTAITLGVGSSVNGYVITLSAITFATRTTNTLPAP